MVVAAKLCEIKLIDRLAQAVGVQMHGWVISDFAGCFLFAVFAE